MEEIRLHKDHHRMTTNHHVDRTSSHPKANYFVHNGCRYNDNFRCNNSNEIFLYIQLGRLTQHSCSSHNEGLGNK
jgi:hypothetical protein